MNGKRTEIYSAYLTLSFAFFLLRNRMREEVPSSATGFLHALEQRFCLLCLSDTGQLSPWFYGLELPGQSVGSPALYESPFDEVFSLIWQSLKNC